jgi:prepilin-type N-terminal cleavage/methylation domain-containing protein
MIKSKMYSQPTPISHFRVPNPQSGFTIVELLVVIVVIGILAAITIVAYAGISQRAKEASLKSDLDNSSKLIKLFQVTEPSGNYPTANVCPSPGTTEICLKASGTNTYTYTVSNGTTPKTFTLDATNDSTVYRITNDSAPVAVVDPYASDPNWIAGTPATALAGKYVRSTDYGSPTTIRFKTSNTVVASPQGATGLDPNYPAYMSLVSPQTYPLVDFTLYPAQNACKAIGGRLPNMYELLAIYAGRVTTYGNNFLMESYWSSTDYNSFYSIGVYFGTGSPSNYDKTSTFNYARCVAG